MTIKKEVFEIRGNLPKGLNPLPAFRSEKLGENKISGEFPEEILNDLGCQNKILPYLMQDRYDRSRELLKLDSFVLENEYLKARFLPSLGGRLHSLYDKKDGRELLFTNSVIQPGNLAIRNAWLSGGIEWNVGNIGHTYTTCDNVYAAILNDGQGNDFLRIYEFERNKSIFWQVDFHLPDGSKQLFSHVKLVNPFDRDTTVYWWTNIAVVSDKRTRVLASNKNVMSYANKTWMYETLPYLKAMNCVDSSYPSNATRAFDFFIQKDKDGESTWESAVDSNGNIFFERSTAPLYYKKLFCWGNHRGGDRWQEFLSDGPGTGYYAEIQAGIAPSQLHDMKFPKKSVIEWTQCFGGMKTDKDELQGEYDDAVRIFNGMLEDAGITEGWLESIDEKFKVAANIPVKEENIYNYGSGYGALEIMRMEEDRDGDAPTNLLFPKSRIGKEESIWEKLLTSGALPCPTPDTVPSSYNVSDKWLGRIEEAYAKDRDNWFAAYQYGVSVYEMNDYTDILSKTNDESKREHAGKMASEAWLKSVECEKNAWSYRCLAFLANRKGLVEDADRYYRAAMEAPGWDKDFAICSEYLSFLISREKYNDAFSLYENLPKSFKEYDRVKISAAYAAIKIGKMEYLDAFFGEEHYDIQEGEVSLTDIWFEYCARKLCKERGIENPSPEELDLLIDEAWDTCPPDPSIDFRMSLDKKQRYRVGE